MLTLDFIQSKGVYLEPHQTYSMKSFCRNSCKKYSFKWTLSAQKCRDKKFVEQQLDHLVTLDPGFIVDLYFSLCFADYHLFPNFQCFLGIFPIFVKSKKSSNKV